MRKRSAIMSAIAAVGVLVVLGAQSAAAATFKVTNTRDSGHGSLRTAIRHANHNGKHFDKIPIKATGKIALDKNLPGLDSDLAIRGPGARKLTLSAKGLGKGRVGFVNQGHTVSVSGISIAQAAAAIYNLKHGTFSVSRSTVSDNKFGILGDEGGTIAVSRSTVSHNRLGIFNAWGTATVSRSTLTKNHKHVDNRHGAVAISQSTLSGALAQMHGDAPAIRNERDAETTIESTIVADSFGGNCRGGVVTSLGHNLADDDTCNLTAQGDQPNTEPLLRPLGNYGGPTDTFALRPTSPAVDAGVAGSTPTDQRGLQRIVDYPGAPKAVGGDNSDTGAFELQAP
jgi:hypothetical protein